ncbi:MAG: hypothetical protein WBD47_16505 [Phormidesmis sp.]
MALSFWKPVHVVLVGSVILSTVACRASRQAAQGSLNALPSLADDGGSICTLNESVISAEGRYSANVDLTASVALPGERGIDVVMTEYGAIAAVNAEEGSLLHWIDPATGEIAQTVTLPAAVSDLAYDGAMAGAGVLAIATENKVLRLDAISGEVLSEIALEGVGRVAIAADGHVGAIAGKTVYLYDANDAEVFSKFRDYTEVTDVEVRSCQGDDANSSVYVTSFRNSSFIDLEDKRNPVQIARLEALDFSGEVQWSLFSDSAETIKQNVADTRLNRVTMGRDGYLYIGGESAGTATIFRWRGQPMSEDEQYGREKPFLERIDEYAQLHNSGAAHLPYYARVHPSEGQLVTSQMSFPRLSNTKANAMRLGDIATGVDGSLYFGGTASASIFNRENLTLNGEPVGGYAGGDRVWMSIAPDFRARNFWTVLAEEGGKGVVQGVDAGYGYSAALSNVESGTVPVTSGDAIGSVFLSFTAEK